MGFSVFREHNLPLSDDEIESVDELNFRAIEALGRQLAFDLERTACIVLEGFQFDRLRQLPAASYVRIRAVKKNFSIRPDQVLPTTLIEELHGWYSKALGEILKNPGFFYAIHSQISGTTWTVKIEEGRFSG